MTRRPLPREHRAASDRISYAGKRSADRLAEDKVIASLPLTIAEKHIAILPIDRVFQ